MPLKNAKDAKATISVWIIHTNRPGYRIMRPELDPDTKELMDTKRRGQKALDTHPLASSFSRKTHAAESLEHEAERESNMLWAVADKNGDFILENGDEAREVWDMLQKDPEPKPTLDEMSPPLPPKKETVAKK